MLYYQLDSFYTRERFEVNLNESNQNVSSREVAQQW
jgi:hypothetical protein